MSTHAKGVITQTVQGGEAVREGGAEVRVGKVEEDSIIGKEGGETEEEQTPRSISQEGDLVAASQELEVNQTARAHSRRELTETTVKNSTKQRGISVEEG